MSNKCLLQRTQTSKMKKFFSPYQSHPLRKQPLTVQYVYSPSRLLNVHIHIMCTCTYNQHFIILYIQFCNLLISLKITVFHIPMLVLFFTTVLYEIPLYGCPTIYLTFSSYLVFRLLPIQHTLRICCTLEVLQRSARYVRSCPFSQEV